MDISKVKEALSCVACKKIPSTQIFLCINGHSFCQICKENLSLCPECKKPIGIYRNYVAEEAIASLQAPCPSCQKLLSLKTYEFHTSGCFLDCVLCDKKKSPSDIVAHLKKKHKIEFKNSEGAIKISVSPDCEGMELGFQIRKVKVLVRIRQYKKTVKKLVLMNLSRTKTIKVEGVFGGNKIDIKVLPLESLFSKAYRLSNKKFRCKFDIFVV